MIFVFKTNVRHKKQVKVLKPYLSEYLPNSQWNFDLEDSDNILRIDSENCSGKRVVELLNNHGFECIELE